jgi:cyclohexadieny/prephenate dehydrogenase
VTDPHPRPIFARLTIVGLGLIGSSLARRARQDRLAAEVVAWDASKQVLARVAELGIVDRVADDAREAATGADCVVLCVPVGAMAQAASGLLPHMHAGAILTDVGSTKQSVIRELLPLLPDGVRLIPGRIPASPPFSTGDGPC